MEKNWYSIKLIYKFIVTGDPDDVDEFYTEDKEIFAQNIMVVMADSFENAYAIAEKSAKEHTDIYTNKYHQTVTYKFEQSLDCYLLGNEITSCIEVYSSIKGVDKNTSIDKFIDDELRREIDINSLHILRREEK